MIDKLYDVACKIVHCAAEKDLAMVAFPKLEEHFSKSGCAPVMMGGDRDAASKGIFGTCRDSKNRWLLVVVGLDCFKMICSEVQLVQKL